MKDSGVEWVGEIPSDWERYTLKNLISKIQGGYWGKETKGNENDIEVIRIADFNRSQMKVDKTQYVLRNVQKDKYLSLLINPEEELLIEKSGGGEKTPVGQTVIVESKQKAIYTNFISKLTIRTEIINLFFLNYIFSVLYTCGFVKKHINQTTGIQNLNLSSYLTELVFIPNIQKQENIANFLNNKTRIIDEIIADTKQSIEELKAYKESIITEAVTKGLDPNAEMKDSGLPWVGEIPKDWKIMKTRFFLKEKSLKGFSDELVLSLYRDYGVIPKDSRDDNHNVTSLDISTYKLVEKGDLVINKMKAWQGSMGISNFRGVISPAYYIYDVDRTNFYLPYLHHMLRNKAYTQEYMRISEGLRIGQWDLNKNEFKNSIFAYPNNLFEQKAIAKYINTKTKQIDMIIKDKEQLLSEYESYKKSLIYEYVTGKKQVEEA